MENKWRAARYGLEGKLVDFGKQTEVPARELVLEYLEFIDDVVDELDSREELNYIHEILNNGTGADRQLRVSEKGRRLYHRRNGSGTGRDGGPVFATPATH